MDIWQKVFGKIEASKVIGATPDLETMEEEFKMELASMELALCKMSHSELVSIRDEQIKIENVVNSRPGAMAVSQKKIRIFTKYSGTYVNLIENRIQMLSD